MRLTPQQRELIRASIAARFGDRSAIWLFGSRTDDDARGGDIDLYVEPEHVPGDNPLLARLAAQRELERRLRNAVDLVLNDGRTTAFMRLAKQEGVRL
jgi:predicted nucleotidyltransferase